MVIKLWRLQEHNHVTAKHQQTKEWGLTLEEQACRALPTSWQRIPHN